MNVPEMIDALKKSGCTAVNHVTSFRCNQRIGGKDQGVVVKICDADEQYSDLRYFCIARLFDGSESIQSEQASSIVAALATLQWENLAKPETKKKSGS
jgi:hypothetical protein